MSSIFKHNFYMDVIVTVGQTKVSKGLLEIHICCPIIVITRFSENEIFLCNTQYTNQFRTKIPIAKWLKFYRLGLSEN